jgi:TonB-dependent receptor-like protein
VHQTFEDGIATRANRRMDPAYQVDDTFSWFLPGHKGDHDVKFGASIYYLPLHVFDAGTLNGRFSFSSSDLDFNAADPRTYPDRLQVRVPAVSDFFVKGTELGVFAQDKWKINSRLTASLGLRYDVETVKMDNTGNFLFADGQESPVDKNNVSPRVGGTWTLDDKGTAVLRGGYGLYFQKTSYSNFTPIVSSGLTSNSFLVNFPANNIDPGPSQGRLPTDPLLANGPVVNRALLNQMFPPGTLARNDGDVWLDNPGRGNAFSRQYTIGYERQLTSDMALTLDYVRSENRDQLMRVNLNPPIRTSTARTAPVTRPDPNFAQNVWELVNIGEYDYNALQLQFNKRFSRGYSYRVSYTLSRTHGNTSNDVGEIVTTQVGDALNLEQGEGPTEDDRTHILSISGTFEVPGVRGLNVNPLVRYMSGLPFTLTSSRQDLNQNGRFDDEYLPAGTYSGTGDNAFTTDNKGGLNGARGPDFFEIDFRTTYALPISGAQRLQLFAEIYNLTNRANFENPGGDQRLSSFLDLRTLRQGNTSRRAQLGIRLAF